jgi:arylsulfatase A-like enzyme
VSLVERGRARVLWRGSLSGAEERWRAIRVPLTGYAGRRVRLRIDARPDDGARTAGLLAVFGEPLVLEPQPRPAAFSNVVLVSIDTLRARSLGAYGGERPTSPTLDGLAEAGVLFENAFSTAAFTLPGHLSMLTGLWFRTHGALGMTTSLPPERRTLAEVLRSAGYSTAAFTSGAWIVPWVGFRRGFDLYHEQPSGTIDKKPVPYEAFTRGLEWMRENAGRPCFVFLHSYLVHAPYLPPPPYGSMFDALPGAPAEERARLAYEQEVRYGDDQLRALLEGLAALGVAERTLVIVTSDHGEQFMEHGETEHSYDLHDEVVHVPLVMRLPGAIPPGIRVAEPTSLADIVPTVVDLLGLPPVHGVDGTSLLPLATGTATQLPRAGVFSEAESAPHVGWVDLAAIHTRAVSCIHDARRDVHECYDRRRDPWQVFPPLPTDAPSPEVLAAKAALARFVAAQPPPVVGPPMMGGAPPPARVPTPAPGVESERREQLRALGYVD